MFPPFLDYGVGIKHGDLTTWQMCLIAVLWFWVYLLANIPLFLLTSKCLLVYFLDFCSRDPFGGLFFLFNPKSVMRILFGIAWLTVGLFVGLRQSWRAVARQSLRARCRQADDIRSGNAIIGMTCRIRSHVRLGIPRLWFSVRLEVNSGVLKGRWYV